MDAVPLSRRRPKRTVVLVPQRTRRELRKRRRAEAAQSAKQRKQAGRVVQRLLKAQDERDARRFLAAGRLKRKLLFCVDAPPPPQSAEAEEAADAAELRAWRVELAAKRAARRAEDGAESDA